MLSEYLPRSRPTPLCLLFSYNYSFTFLFWSVFCYLLKRLIAKFSCFSKLFMGFFFHFKPCVCVILKSSTLSDLSAGFPTVLSLYCLLSFDAANLRCFLLWCKCMEAFLIFRPFIFDLSQEIVHAHNFIASLYRGMKRRVY